jgi:hypothetical protein
MGNMFLRLRRSKKRQRKTGCIGHSYLLEIDGRG